MSKMNSLLQHAYPVPFARETNQGKLDQLSLLYTQYAKEYQGLLPARWAKFIKEGSLTLFKRGSLKGYAGPLTFTYHQICTDEAINSLKSHVTALARKITQYLNHSSVKGRLRHEVSTINRKHAWPDQGAPMTGSILYLQSDFGDEIAVPNPVVEWYDIPYGTGYWGSNSLSDEAIKLSRQLFRQAQRVISFPRVAYPRLVLDTRVLQVEDTCSTSYPVWARISSLVPGKRVALPLKLTKYCQSAPGILANSCELLVRPDEATRLVFVKKATFSEYHDYLFGDVSSIEKSRVVAFDFGLCTLLASSEGNCYGQYWLDKLSEYDRQLTALTTSRQKLGLKHYGTRQKVLVQRIRGFIKSEVGRIVNAYVGKHPDLMTVVLESLHFRVPNLSKKLNRLIQNCGLARLHEKFEELGKVCGFEVVKCQPAYTSRTCSHCGWVSKNSRSSQAVFCCELCGTAGNADVQASRNILKRFQEGNMRLTKHKALAELKRQFLAGLAGLLRRGLATPERVWCLSLRKGQDLFDKGDRLPLAVALGMLTWSETRLVRLPKKALQTFLDLLPEAGTGQAFKLKSRLEIDAPHHEFPTLNCT